VSAARRKGSALELEVAKRLQAIDGRDSRLRAIESPGGRLGGAYEKQIDIATWRFAVECKNREDNPARLWQWLDKLTGASYRLANDLRGRPKTPLLVLKRNGRSPIVVLAIEDFEDLLTKGNE
jgi:hypothetical protein